MGWPDRLAEVARPGAGCALRDSDKWTGGRAQGDRPEHGARVAGTDAGRGRPCQRANGT